MVGSGGSNSGRRDAADPAPGTVGPLVAAMKAGWRRRDATDRAPGVGTRRIWLWAAAGAAAAGRVDPPVAVVRGRFSFLIFVFLFD
jgi:hypothetical protein